MRNNLNSTLQPRIYVACLAAYNSGYLHGALIDAAPELWGVYDDVKAMLAASPIAGAEEWAIHDDEGFGDVRIEEYTGFERVSELAAFIAEHREVGAALLDHFDGDVEEAREAIADRYRGQHASLADYVQEVTEEGTSIPQTLRYYIDYRAMARDAGSMATCSPSAPLMMWCMCLRGADMEQQSQTYRFCWQGIEIEATYTPCKWGVTAHLEIRSIAPAGAPLPITSTGYRSHFHHPGTVEAHGGDIVAQVIAWLDEEATSREWLAYVEGGRQGELF